MSCATCHVLVDEALIEVLSRLDKGQNQMLDYIAAPHEAFRQIVMRDKLDGIAVHIAAPQL